MFSPLSRAEEALERGDYGKCITFLEDLIEIHPSSETEISQIRILLVTAYIGKGDTLKAISTCKLLTKCPEKNIREKAKQLLPILEAPSLKRPSNWSIEIPNLNQESIKKSKLVNSIPKKNINDRKIYHPPTGTTKDLDLGFSLLVFIVIFSLILFLN